MNSNMATSDKPTLQKVLFIAFQFPPMGGPGVHRSVNLVRHLRDSGIEPIVLTIDSESIRRGKYVVDESILAALPPGINIIRVPSFEPVAAVNLLMKLRVFRLFWFLFYPLFWERSARWPNRVFTKAKQIVQEHDIRLVYTSSGPFSPLKLGRALQKKLGLKWVADLRDPFTDAYSWNFPTWLHWRAARSVEKALLEFPDVLVVNTHAVKRLYQRRGIRKEKRTEVIHNGF